MAETWRYRGQEIGSEQIAFLREFIGAHPTSSRWKLSRELCAALGWTQANGALRDMVCRGLLLMLERAGQIELPPVRRHIRGQCRTERPRPDALLIDTSPLEMELKELGPIEIQPVRRTADEPLFNSLMEHYHYLAYEQPVGEHLKYLIVLVCARGFRLLSGAIIALLKYGTGVPFKRLERLQEHLGLPLPATTEWDLMAAAAKLLWPVLAELIRQAAQGSVLHNDDTGMRILRLAREPGDKRTGTFTSGIVSMVSAWTIALFFTGWKHAARISPRC